MRGKNIFIVSSAIVVSTLVTCFLIMRFKASSSVDIDGITYENNYERYNKFVEKATRLKQPSICDDIVFGQNHDDYNTSVEESRYFCRADYAVKARDVEYCKTLDTEIKFPGTITQKDKCLRDLAKELNDKSLCEFLTNKIYCPI